MAPRQIPFKHLRRRFRRSFYYGPHSRMDQLSLPLTEAAASYFDDHSPFDYLDMDFATNLSKEGCVEPCSLILALVYLDRLRLRDKDYFQTSDPNDLYLAALLVSSKFLHDDGEAESVYNDEWAASSKKPLHHVNQKEIQFLQGIDWRLMVEAAEFYQVLERIEAAVTGKQAKSRPQLTYQELHVLSRSMFSQEFLWNFFLQPLLATLGLASLVYSSAVFSLYYSLTFSTTLPALPPSFRPLSSPLLHPRLSPMSPTHTVAYSYDAPLLPSPPLVEPDIAHGYRQDPDTVYIRSSHTNTKTRDFTPNDSFDPDDPNFTHKPDDQNPIGPHQTETENQIIGLRQDGAYPIGLNQANNHVLWCGSANGPQLLDDVELEINKNQEVNATRSYLGEHSLFPVPSFYPSMLIRTIIT